MHHHFTSDIVHLTDHSSILFRTCVLVLPGWLQFRQANNTKFAFESSGMFLRRMNESTQMDGILQVMYIDEASDFHGRLIKYSVCRYVGMQI